MSRLIRPGLQFYVDVIDPVYPTDGSLCRTFSTYGHGPDFEVEPQRNELYIIRNDGTVISVRDPERPIGWEIFESENNCWFYKVSQAGHRLKACVVRACSDSDSREAAIYETEDEGEPEVTSPQCPGAPRKTARNVSFGSDTYIP